MVSAGGETDSQGWAATRIVRLAGEQNKRFPGLEGTIITAATTFRRRMTIELPKIVMPGLSGTQKLRLVE